MADPPGTSTPLIASIQNPSQRSYFLVFNVYLVPTQPSWIRDVHRIFLQFEQLYPVITRIVDLSNDGNIKQRISIVAMVFGVPVTDPNEMLVTRDLSDAKPQMILKWLDNLVCMDIADRNQLIFVLQRAVEMADASIPVCLTAM